MGFNKIRNISLKIDRIHATIQKNMYQKDLFF